MRSHPRIILLFRQSFLSSSLCFLTSRRVVAAGHHRSCIASAASHRLYSSCSSSSSHRRPVVAVEPPRRLLASHRIVRMLSASAPSTTTTTTDFDWASYDEEQVRLMAEMCIVVDKDDRPIGADTKKNCYLMTRISEGLLHRAFSVFLFDSQNRLCLQQRADEKITFPGYFTNTCCSHPLAVQDEVDEVDQMGARRAAQRKLEHELGIKPEQAPLEKLDFLTRIHYLAPSDGMWGEHEIDYIFIIRADVELNPNPNEVKSVRYVTKQELQEIFESAEAENVKLTPWFRLIVENFLYKWWDNLDDLKSFKDAQTIHRM